MRPWSFTKRLPPASDETEIVIIGADPEMDTVFTPEEAEALSKSRPDIKCIIAIGAGHGIQREQPEFVVRVATAPLSSL
jgi:pimeloyl-ACP methyl ester carboxylesterase